MNVWVSFRRFAFSASGRRRGWVMWLIFFLAFVPAFSQTTQDNEPRQTKPDNKLRLERTKTAYRVRYLHFGIKGGPNRGNVLINPAGHIEEFLPQNGFGAMAFATIANVRRPLAFQIELGYVNKQSGWSVDYNDTLTRQLFDLHYLTLPVALKVSTGKQGILGKPYLFILTGLEFNLLLRANLHLDTEGTGQQITYNETGRVKGTEVGGWMGLGVAIPLPGRWQLLLESRGGFGLTDFNRGVVINQFNLRNIYAQVNVGVAFNW